MNTFAALALIAGCLLLLMAIASVVVFIRYRPTVEYASVESGQRSVAVTGWRRAVALSAGVPMFTLVLLLRALGLFRER